MMRDDTPSNPYLEDELSIAPFAGRQQVFAALHQHLTETANRRAALVMGQRQMGKTALLRQFDAVFDESFVGVYVALKDTQLHSETAWLETLVDAVSAILDQRGFGLKRLMERTKEDFDLRDWVKYTRLPDVFATIRMHRRLVLLLDDADRLFDAVTAGRLPADSFTYLQGLLEEHRQLGMVMTIGAEHEAKLEAMKPLIDPAAAIRLTYLAPEDSAHLLRQPVMGMYTVPDDSAAAIHSATGGHPLMVQRFGFYLFHHWQTHADEDTMTPETVKSLSARVYTDSEDEFKYTWQRLSRDERLVLTAASSMTFADPLKKIDTRSIEGWLVETDYPTDATTINAAIRSLEYDEIIQHGERGIGFTAGLMQQWLIENAGLDDRPASAAAATSRKRILWLAAILLVIAVLLAIAALNIPRTEPKDTPAPTVTLLDGD